jgi:predicted unusual protein kinase regulating ubiquinone biosynthesis (AarF/ABC1/UbiB family)
MAVMADRERPTAVEGGRLRRTAPLVGLTARTAGEAVIHSLRKRARGPGASAEFHARTAERYTQLLGQSKGVLMKAGQMLSFVSLGTSLPQEYRALYRDALARLQADAPPMEPELAAETFAAEIGRRPEDVFVEFSPEPLAAASIGQVHAARLPDGHRVAVKIQYPGVERAIRADLQNDQLLTTFFSLLRSMIPGWTRWDMKAAAVEIAERITEELDYLHEAENQSFFADAYRGHPFIHVPDVVPELCARRVLTQDLVVGMPWAEAVYAERPLRDQWGEVIYRFAIGSLRRLRAFNADPHPGNYIFHTDGTVSFVDFGCVKHFEQARVDLMNEVIVSMCHGDAARFREAWVRFGAIEADGGPSAEAMLEWWSENMEMLLAPQPYTVTRERVAAGIEREFSPLGPSASVVRALNPPPDMIFLTRIDTGMMSILGELEATGYWRSIQAELDEGADPHTELGRIERAFWNKRIPLDA